MRRTRILVFCRRPIPNLGQNTIGEMRRKRKKRSRLLRGGQKQRRVTLIPGPAAGRKIGGRAVSSRFWRERQGRRPGNLQRKSRNWWRRRPQRATPWLKSQQVS